MFLGSLTCFALTPFWSSQQLKWPTSRSWIRLWIREKPWAVKRSGKNPLGASYRQVLAGFALDLFPHSPRVGIMPVTIQPGLYPLLQPYSLLLGKASQ
jgi:hypothetical protein